MASKKAGGGKKAKAEPSAKARKPAKRRPKRSPRKPINRRQMYALSRKVRVRILALLCERIANPKQISVELNEGVGQVNYHVKVLRECGLIVLDHKTPRGGVVEHFYRATIPTLIPPGAWDHLSESVRKGVSVVILQHFFEETLASMEAAAFNDSPGELSWTPLILDATSVEEFGRLRRDFLKSVLELHAKASKRLSKEDGKTTDTTSATVFLASFPSARSARDDRKTLGGGEV